jgi:N-formylglutamate deformylase
MSVPDFLQARPAEPVLVHPARGEVLPIVCDSPHSGTAYPEDFGAVVPMSLLRRGEDTHVAALWDRWPEFGATLLEATFPRTYVDPNRNESDLDPAQIEGEWPVPLSPSIKTQQGLGLIWQRISKAGVATPCMSASAPWPRCSTVSSATGAPITRRWRRPSTTAWRASGPCGI